MSSKSTLLSLIILSALTQQLYAVHIGYKDDSYEDPVTFKAIKMRTIVVDFKRATPPDLTEVGHVNTPKNQGQNKDLALTLDQKVQASTLLHGIKKDNIDILFRNTSIKQHTDIVEKVSKELISSHKCDIPVGTSASPTASKNIKELNDLLDDDIKKHQDTIKDAESKQEEEAEYSDLSDYSED